MALDYHFFFSSLHETVEPALVFLIYGCKVTMKRYTSCYVKRQDELFRNGFSQNYCDAI